MKKNIKLLDCTLRDGAYIVEGRFGTTAIHGIIDKLQNSNIELIECGWLKNNEHEDGMTYFHLPNDLNKYIDHKVQGQSFVAMIDWDRYDDGILPMCDGNSIDAVRVVFPRGKHKEGAEIAKRIKEKGYDIYLQAANTLAYTDDELIALSECINALDPVALSVVDTFGAMYQEDLERIVKILDRRLDDNIKIGFHSHNNQQLSFALSIHFISLVSDKREIIIDSSLCGMGRGAGNTTTELIANYLNTKHHKNYDMNSIMDAIDMYMPYFKEKYSWGYSTPYFISGIYCCHVNNIAYLLKNHRVCFKEMRKIIESLGEEDRKKYDYDLLESKYIENQNTIVDDSESIALLNERLRDRIVLLVAPGKSTVDEFDKINDFIIKKNPIVIFVNAINPNYKADYIFLVNKTRYEYAAEVHPEEFNKLKKIVLSNIKSDAGENELVINFGNVIKRGWKHFDNSVITCLRFMDKLKLKNVYLAGFDGFKHKYNESYADEFLPTLNPDNKWDELNEEIKDMYQDFIESSNYLKEIVFLTSSYFE